MPVILAKEDWDTWLDPAAEGALDLLAPYPDAWLSVYPVSTWVNNVSHDDPRCIKAVAR